LEEGGGEIDGGVGRCRWVSFMRCESIPKSTAWPESMWPSPWVFLNIVGIPKQHRQTTRLIGLDAGRVWTPRATSPRVGWIRCPQQLPWRGVHKSVWKKCCHASNHVFRPGTHRHPASPRRIVL